MNAPYCTPGDAAKIVGVSPQMIRVYEAAGKLRAMRTAGGIRLFFQEELEAFAKRRNEQRKTPPVQR